MKAKLAVFFMVVLSALTIKGQEDQPFISFEVPAQNLLKFNRFLINPTFSSVREDQSYVNLYHRNQWVQFEDSPELYFASYSGRIGDRTGFGLGLYQQQLGVINNFGILANYAYGVRLNDKMNLTFGFNLSYFSSGLDTDQIISGEIDPVLLNLNNGSFLSFQPGFNLSIGSFDLGVYAENLVDYNLRTSESLTDFSEKTFSGHLMYTRKFKKASGILENGKLSVLSRVRKQGDRDVNLSGSLIADLPKLGWLQGGYDDFYGVSAGIGFNLTKRLSLGYTIEKGVNSQTENLGPTHEITFAYSFQPKLTEDRVKLEEEEKEELVELEEQIKTKDSVITVKDEEIAEIKANLAENTRVLAELIIKQDSMENAVNEDIEKRFYYLIKNMKDNPTFNNNTNRKRNTTGNKNFVDAAKANNIKQQVFKNLMGVEDGYYIIANVYSDTQKGTLYRNNFIQDLNDEGFNAAYFTNSNNNLDYVYLERYDDWQDAIDAYKSRMNNTYDDAIWIMNVDNDYDNNTIANNTKSNNTYTSNNNKNVTSKIEPKRKRINSPSNTNNKNINNDNSVTENTKTEKRISTPVTKSKTNTKTPNTKPSGTSTKDYADLEDATEAEIKERFSKNTSKKRKAAKKGRVYNINNQDYGYYIIANVFSVQSNADRFVAKLKKQGLDAAYFVNPENNYRYVYLKKHDTWNSALASYYSNLNDSYYDEIWIMRVNINYVL